MELHQSGPDLPDRSWAQWWWLKQLYCIITKIKKKLCYSNIFLKLIGPYNLNKAALTDKQTLYVLALLASLHYVPDVTLCCEALADLCFLRHWLQAEPYSMAMHVVSAVVSVARRWICSACSPTRSPGWGGEFQFFWRLTNTSYVLVFCLQPFSLYARHDHRQQSENPQSLSYS